MKCRFCERDLRFRCRLIPHELSCNKNPEKPPRKVGNQYTKAKELGLPKPIVNQRIWTEELRIRQSAISKRINSEYWSNEENIKKHSLVMKEVVRQNPDSYSKNNVSGRAKIYEINSTTGPTKVKGLWELKVATWLNANNINWTNSIDPYNYYWNNEWHMYFPDFLLIELNVLIEVKGYETERDRIKWRSVKDKPLIILKEDKIKNLSRSMEEVIRSVS